MTEKQNRPSKLPEDLKNETEKLGFERNSMPAPEAPVFQPNMHDLKDIKSARTLIMIANIAGPVSLFIGGVLLGTVGLVCGIIGYRKTSALLRKQSSVADAAARMRRSGIVAMSICAVAIVLNAIAIYLMFPIVVEMLETGDYTAIVPGAGSGAGANSTWG